MLKAEDWKKLHEEAERVAMEMADYYGALKYPIDAYFKVVVTSYYADGLIYEVSTHSTPFTEMNDCLEEAERYNWEIRFDEETKVYTLEKHFPNGMYRIATYTPYNKDVIEVKVYD